MGYDLSSRIVSLQRSLSRLSAFPLLRTSFSLSSPLLVLPSYFASSSSSYGKRLHDTQLPSALARAPMVSRSPLPLLLLTILSGLLLVLWPFPQSTFTSLGLDALPSSFVASASTPRNASAAAEWGDFARIKRRSRPYSEGVVAPLRLRHLQQYQAPEPFREVSVGTAGASPKDAPSRLWLIVPL